MYLNWRCYLSFWVIGQNVGIFTHESWRPWELFTFLLHWIHLHYDFFLPSFGHPSPDFQNHAACLVAVIFFLHNLYFRLVDVISKLSLQKGPVLRYMTSVIQPILEKGIVDHSIIHRVLIEYFSIADQVFFENFKMHYSFFRTYDSYACLFGFFW